MVRCGDCDDEWTVDYCKKEMKLYNQQAEIDKLKVVNKSLLEYKEHHEFVLSQLVEMTGIKLETLGDLVNWITKCKTRIAKLDGALEEIENELPWLTPQSLPSMFTRIVAIAKAAREPVPVSREYERCYYEGKCEYDNSKCVEWNGNFCCHFANNRDKAARRE